MPAEQILLLSLSWAQIWSVEKSGNGKLRPKHRDVFGIFPDAWPDRTSPIQQLLHIIIDSNFDVSIPLSNRISIRFSFSVKVYKLGAQPVENNKRWRRRREYSRCFNVVCFRPVSTSDQVCFSRPENGKLKNRLRISEVRQRHTTLFLGSYRMHRKDCHSIL